MNLTTKQIAEEINGTVEGDSEIQISQLSKIEEGRKAQSLFLQTQNILIIYIRLKHLQL